MPRQFSNLHKPCRLLVAAAVVACLWWAVVFAREVPITILHTCDLHGNVLPTEDYQGRTNLGGIARCATVIRQVRQQEKNVLLVDAGDTIQGAAIGYLTEGQVMVKALNHLRYDAWVLGNHEFDWGLQKLAACVERAEMPILNANVRQSSAGVSPAGQRPENGRDVRTTMPQQAAAARILSRIKPWIIRDIDGVKVAIIGLNTPGIPNWSRPRLIDGLKFADSVETLQKIVPEIKEAGAQVIVLVAHQGYRDGPDDHANQINTIARNVPELDVIIGAHTHRHFPEFKVGKALYTQANYFGIHVGRVDLVFDTEAGRLTKRQSNTMLMDESVPLDGEMLKLLAEEIDRAGKILGTVLGEATADFTLEGAPRKETPIHNLIFEAIAEALEQRGAKVDAIVHGILDRRATIQKGPVTIGDVWRVVPYENTIGVAQLTPAELTEILEENAARYESEWAFRGIWGLKWTLDPKAARGQRTIALQRADGAALEQGKRLAVAFNSYELASGGLRWTKLREIADRADSKLVEYDFQTRQAVIDYIRKRGQISPVVKGWWNTQAGAAKQPAEAP